MRPTTTPIERIGAALTSAALADGTVELTDTQLDQITAGVSVDNNRARGLEDDVIDTLRGFNPPTSDPEARRGTVPSGGDQAMYFTPRIGGARTGNPAVSTAFIPS